MRLFAIFNRRYYNLANFSPSGVKRWWLDEDKLSYLGSCNLKRDELLSARSELSIDFRILKAEIEVFEEIGATVNVPILKRSRKYLKDDLRSLCMQGIISDVNVDRKLVSHLENFPYDPAVPVPSPEGIEEVYKKIKQYHRKALASVQAAQEWPRNVKLEMSKTIETEQKKVLRQYYVWRLESNFYTIDRLMYNYSKITGTRSIRSLRKTLDILEHDLQFSKQKILRNFFLMSIIPERLLDVINNVDNIGGIPLKTCIHSVPKILAKSSNQIKEIDQALLDHGITAEYERFRNQVFTYTPRTVHERLKTIKSSSHLEPFLNHPRVCELLFYFRKALARSQELENRGFKCCSLNVLMANEKVFRRFLNDGVDRIHVSRDLVLFVSRALNTPIAKFDKLLGRHPMRFYVPISEVKLTLDALLTAGFSEDVISSCVTILLYPKDKVLEALEVISKSEELIKLDFEKGFSAVTDTFTSGIRHVDKRLPLCLYLLEKPYHFTGEGATIVKSNYREEPEEVCVWESCHINKPCLPMLEDCGWMFNTEQRLVPRWMLLDPIPKTSPEIVICHCQGKCNIATAKANVTQRTAVVGNWVCHV